jgi:hypothetical protein
MELSMNAMTIWNTITGESRSVPAVQAEVIVRGSRGEWSFKQPLPPGWDLEEPRYRASIDLRPPFYARYRYERPVSGCSDTHEWQYCGDTPIKAGQEITTTAWCHPSLVPLNETAQRVRDFFVSAQKSRLPMSPWRNGRLHLDDGLSGVAPVPSTLRPKTPSAFPTVATPIRVA